MANKGTRPIPPPATGTPPDDSTPPEGDDSAPPAAGEGTLEADETGAVTSSTPPPPKARKGKPAEAEVPLAFVQDTDAGFVARPHPQRHLSTIPGDLVLTNWVGHVDGKPCEVAYGTPLSELPAAVVDAIVNTRRQPVGPLPARLPPNPMQP